VTSTLRRSPANGQHPRQPARSPPIASPVATWAGPVERPRPNVAVRLGSSLWGLLTSVNFAVLQIIVLGLMAVVGMTIRQLPAFAFRSPSDYATEMDKLHARYDAAFGTAVVDLLEKLQVFHIFSSTWFTAGLILLILSIVVCTLNRTPRLWRQCADIRVVQPPPFFDPRLPDRAALSGVAVPAAREVLQRHRFGVRQADHADETYLYGDRNRWTKLATLLTHTGLILFLVAAGITWKLGDEQGLVVAEGDTTTVQPIGTPGLLLIRNLDFEAPGFATGMPTDFTTDLQVFKDGQEIARKTIRVNDPLSVDGYTFHQNGFGPAPDLVIRDRQGSVLWSGPVALTDTNNGLPYDTMAVPGRDVGLAMLLQRADDGTGVLRVLPYRYAGTSTDGTAGFQPLGLLEIIRGEEATSQDIDFSIELRSFADYSLIIAKKDPGQGIVWLAFGSLIGGILITFYLPRRRVWLRFGPEGEVAIVGRSDRYVDFNREFGRLLDDLVAARAPTRSS
jgi:cytochrome c biogenesis protein